MDNGANGQWSGKGVCSGITENCCATAEANPINRDPYSCPESSYCRRNVNLFVFLPSKWCNLLV